MKLGTWYFDVVSGFNGHDTEWLMLRPEGDAIATRYLRWYERLVLPIVRLRRWIRLKGMERINE